jgi:hypothetical protein
VLLAFVERSPAGVEGRLLVGVAFAGPYICVNTRQLKLLVSRCKSSINGSFQQLGYTSMRAKSGELLGGILPSLAKEAAALRQWTVRCTSEAARFCFALRAICPAAARRGPPVAAGADRAPRDPRPHARPADRPRRIPRARPPPERALG